MFPSPGIPAEVAMTTMTRYALTEMKGFERSRLVLSKNPRCAVERSHQRRILRLLPVSSWFSCEEASLKNVKEYRVCLHSSYWLRVDVIYRASASPTISSLFHVRRGLTVLWPHTLTGVEFNSRQPKESSFQDSVRALVQWADIIVGPRMDMATEIRLVSW